MSQIVENVACTQCGCVCDDLAITIESNRIVGLKNACRIAEEWYGSQHHSIDLARINGKATSLDAAVERAVTILRESHSPLIFGLSHSSTDAQRHAVALAETLRGTIDTTASTGHAPSIIALQQVGESTCTLGEVKQRADLVIYWGCDPDVTHPRHRERYAPDRPGRSIVIVDDETNESRRTANHFVPIASGEHFPTLATLRSLTSERAITASEPIRRFAEFVRQSKFGIIFFGKGITAEPVANRVVEELLKWVTELNDSRRFYARRLRRSGDVAGADSVLAWQTGYPFAVNFATGFPRSNPGEFSGPEMLARGEIDACLLVGRASDLPASAISRAEQVPLITIESPGQKHAREPAVQFFTADYGLHRMGTAYRMDEVAIPLRTVLDSPLPSDADILTMIRNRLA